MQPLHRRVRVRKFIRLIGFHVDDSVEFHSEGWSIRHDGLIVVEVADVQIDRNQTTVGNIGHVCVLNTLWHFQEFVEPLEANAPFGSVIRDDAQLLELQKMKIKL